MDSLHVAKWGEDFMLEGMLKDRRVVISINADGSIDAFTLEKKPEGGVDPVVRSPYEALKWFEEQGVDDNALPTNVR